MPTYVWQCRECNHVVELIQKISEKKPPESCLCGQPMDEVIGAPAFILKGGGWAKDGYGSSGRK